jgi:hypothetical protein
LRKNKQDEHKNIHYDPLRITLNIQGLGMTGFDTAARLDQEHQVVVELATAKVAKLNTESRNSSDSMKDAIVDAIVPFLIMIYMLQLVRL